MEVIPESDRDRSSYFDHDTSAVHESAHNRDSADIGKFVGTKSSNAGSVGYVAGTFSNPNELSKKNTMRSNEVVEQVAQ